MNKALLVTGVPGFIGARLVKKLLPQGRQIFLLCEKRFERATHDFAKQLGGGDRLVVVTGDITQPNLGLGDAAERVRAEVDEVYHLAAVYDLAVGEDLARRVNVLGTDRVLEFLRSFGEGKVRHNYVSTCYVAGNRQGMIFENELDRGQSFKNHYESTKFAAEVLVERSKRDLETVVLRPSIVIGDSKTGETAKFDGPYATFGAVIMGWTVVYPGPGRARPNFVPVDFIVDALATIPRQPDVAGKTFQLADPFPITSLELMTMVAERLGAPRPRYSVPVALFKPLLKVKKMVELSGITPESFAYFNHNALFDTTNTRAALAGTGVSVPPLQSYINQILRYYRDRADLPWRFDTPA